MTRDAVWAFPLYLHESVAVVHEGAARDLLEGLADVRQRLGLLDQRLVVVDQRQGHAEQDFGPLVEQAIPNSQHGLRGGKARSKPKVTDLHRSAWRWSWSLPGMPSVSPRVTPVHTVSVWRANTSVQGVSASQITIMSYFNSRKPFWNHRVDAPRRVRRLCRDR